MKTITRVLFAVLVSVAVAITASPAQAQDALDKMETVFEGDRSRAEIKRYVDNALRLYDLPITEEYYNRAGSVLVSLQNSQEVDATEMEILICTIEAHTPSVNVEWPNMAALCATQLSAR